MLSFLRPFLAFPLKEWRLARSYRFAFVLNLASVLTGVATFFYLGRLFAHSSWPGLDSYRGYFPFALVGIACGQFLIASLNGLANTLRYERDLGTLEAVLVAPIPEIAAVFGMVIWNVLFSFSMALLYFLAGAAIAPLAVTAAAAAKTLLVLALSALMFLSLGGLAASFILVFKRGNPITWAFSSLSVFLGGVYFPLDVLPPPLRDLAHYLPLTISIRLTRAVFLRDLPLREATSDLYILLAISISCIVISSISLQRALRSARLRGGLGHQ